jgi:tRNA(Ile)-lysidine synthase TilS/MesJ
MQKIEPENARITMQICNKCILNEKFPGIKFNAEGICNYCSNAKGPKNQIALKEKYYNKFNSIMRTYRDKSTYDCLVAYSGGKDSTYTLQFIKSNYDVNILALSFNNWFQSETAISNIHNVLANIAVDHLTILPSFEDFKKIINASTQNNLYPLKALERATSICTTCLALIRFACLKVAIEKQIPVIIFGMSPGQAPIATSVFKTNKQMIEKMQNAILPQLQSYVGDSVKKYFLEERHFAQSNSFPYIINPLAFLQYDENEIYKQIHEVGWRSPEDTDSNSTNCLLNGFANQIHLKKYGYHPYSLEIANFVREGVLSREEAFQRLSQDPDPAIIEKVKAILEM